MFSNRFDTWSRFNADGSPGGAAGENDTDSSPSQSFQRLLDRHNNDATALANRLFDENYQARQRVRQLESQLQAVQEQVPDDTAIVLTGDDAAAWGAYKELGAPEAVRERVEQASVAQSRLDQLEREAALRQVAETAGYKHTVLARLDATARAEGKELGFEVKEVDQDGEKQRVAYVKDGDTETPLVDYAAVEWSDFLPALTVVATEPQGGAGQATGGTRFAPQQPNATPRKPETTKTVAENYVKNTYRRSDNG